MHFRVVVAAALVAAAANVTLAAPEVRRQLDSRQTGSAPCAIVSSSASAALAVAPSGISNPLPSPFWAEKARPTIDAQLAYDCLNSVPLRAKEAVDLVDAVRPYVEWQSDLAYLKDPPRDYFFPAVDILGTLDAVRTNITNGVYQNEYQSQVGLFKTFTQAHDGHFVFYPDALTKAFSWRRQVALVSVSSDGLEIPKIYVYNDTMASLSPGSTFKPSAVTKINDVEASRYLQEISNQATPFQDADAGYNAMFFEKAGFADVGITGYFQGGGPFSYIWPGPTTTLLFENGTSTTYRNIAQVKSSFTGVTDGDSFYQKFCTGSTTTAAPSATSSSTSSATSSPPAATTAPGYPVPVVISSDSVISGYYLNEPGSEDVAVLSVLDFSPESPEEFQAVAQKFISGAKTAGKKKLLVDLSINGGGFLFLGYDLFRQLFPQTAQDGFTRFRENPGFMKIAQVISDSIPANFSKSSSPDEIIQNYESFYNFRYDLDISNATFRTFDAKFGARQDKADSFTNVVRWDLSDPLTTSNTTFGLGIDITGYGNRSNFVQPFAAEDIILVYDGFCASTCTVFSEFMRLQAGVKSIAFGGRPSNTAIQGIGGVKGSQSYDWESIYSDAQRALSIQKAANQSSAAELLAITALPINRSIASGVNLRDNVLPTNLGDGVPAQFVTEMADCRLFWTAEMIGDVKAVWNAAAKAAWGNADCVAGGFPKTNNLTTGTPNTPTGPSRTGLVKTEVVKSSLELTKDSNWDMRHGVKVSYG